MDQHCVPSNTTTTTTTEAALPLHHAHHLSQDTTTTTTTEAALPLHHAHHLSQDTTLTHDSHVPLWTAPTFTLLPAETPHSDSDAYSPSLTAHYDIPWAASPVTMDTLTHDSHVPLWTEPTLLPAEELHPDPSSHPLTAHSDNTWVESSATMQRKQSLHTVPRSLKRDSTSSFSRKKRERACAYRRQQLKELEMERELKSQLSSMKQEVERLTAEKLRRQQLNSFLENEIHRHHQSLNANADLTEAETS